MRGTGDGNKQREHGLMYHAHYGSFRACGIVGRVPRADPHDLISRIAGNEEQRKNAKFAHIEVLLKEQLRREEDGIKEYNYLMEEVSKAFPQMPQAWQPFAKSEQLKQVLKSILETEKHHAGLLRQLIAGLGK